MTRVIIFIALTIAVIGIIKKDPWPRWLTLSVVGLLLLMAIFELALDRKEAKDKSSLKYSGILRKRSKLIFSIQKNIVPKIEIGNGGTIFGFKGNEGSIKFFDDNRIRIVIDKGQVKVTTLLRDNSGTAIAELVNNEWKVNQNNSFDRNYSKDALEVKDNTGDIVLQVRVLNDRIQFQGKFYDGDGNGFAIGVPESGQDAIIEKTGSAYPNLKLKIKPIFQYPSDNHLGKLCDTK